MKNKFAQYNESHWSTSVFEKTDKLRFLYSGNILSSIQNTDTTLLQYIYIFTSLQHLKLLTILSYQLPSQGSTILNFLRPPISWIVPSQDPFYGFSIAQYMNIPKSSVFALSILFLLRCTSLSHEYRYLFLCKYPSLHFYNVFHDKK